MNRTLQRPTNRGGVAETAERSASPPLGVRPDDESRRRIRAKLIRGGLACLVALAAFLVILLWQREERNLAALKLNLQEEFIVPLQARIDGLGGLLPLELYASGESGWNYPLPEDARLLRRYKGPVLVGHSPPLTLFMRRDGYLAVVFDAGKLRIEWMPEPEFFERVVAQHAWIEAERQALRNKPPDLP